jgi:hypothetical protein
VKAIPPKEELEGWLYSPAGVNRIASQFEDALESGKTKNLRGSKKQIEDFAEGKTEGVPLDMKDKVNEHAKQLLELINQMFEGRDAQGKVFKPTPRNEPKITDELLAEAITEYYEGDKKKLIDWLGENNDNRHTQKRQKVLRENREAIRNLPRDDDDLFYYTFRKPGEKTVYVTEPDADMQKIRDSFSGIDGLSFREDLDDQEEEKDEDGKVIPNPFNELPGVAIIPPKRMSLQEYKKFNEVIEKLRAEKITIYKLKGLKLPSVMLSVVGDVEEEALTAEERSAKAKFEDKGKVKYKANVTTSNQVLTYFELLTKKGWNNPIFMPETIMRTKAKSKAMGELLGEKGGWMKQKIPNPLRVVLESSTFDLSSMFEGEHMKGQEINYSIRRLIATDEDNATTRQILDKAKVTQVELNALREKAQKTSGGKSVDWPRFERNLKAKDAAGLNITFNKLIESMKGPTENLFNSEEIDFFEGLKGKTEEEVEDAIADFYEVDIDTVLDSEVTIATRRIVNKDNIFATVGGLYKLDKNHSYKDRELFTRVFRAFRKQKYTTVEPVDISNASLGAIKNTLTENYKPTEWADSVSIIDCVLNIDFYYRRGLIEETNRYYDAREEEGGEEALRKLIAEITKDYPEILQSLITATNEKIQNIINNREDYIKEMQFKVKRSKGKTYEILKPLRRENLVVEIGEE